MYSHYKMLRIWKITKKERRNTPPLICHPNVVPVISLGISCDLPSIPSFTEILLTNNMEVEGAQSDDLIYVCYKMMTK